MRRWFDLQRNPSGLPGRQFEQLIKAILQGCAIAQNQVHRSIGDEAVECPTEGLPRREVQEGRDFTPEGGGLDVGEVGEPVSGESHGDRAGRG